jgi:serine phosphatase RsbU (regulator of sigma subunit)
MDLKRLRWATLGITLALVSVAIWLVFLLIPNDPNDPWRLRAIMPVVAAAVVLVTLPYVISLFAQQQERIERLRREIETLHAMDTAIVRELDVPRLLDVAIRRIMRALDAEAAGIVLLPPDPDRPGDEAFSVPDRTEEDQRLFEVLLRGGGRPDLHWEAIVLPLEESGGPVGYIGVARYRPCRNFAPSDHGLLSALGDTVAVALTNARAFEAARRTAKVQADLERERRVASALTEGLLPDIPPRAGRWAFSMKYQPQSPDAPVGGDIYDLFLLGNGRWGVVIADVSGKGLMAARKTAMVKYSLRSYAREHASPARVLEQLNDALFDEPDLTDFVTLIYGVLDESNNTLTYASAGHEPPILRRADGKFETLPPTGVVLGVVRDNTYRDNRVVFRAGDGLLLYTDGLSDARTKDGMFLNGAGIEQFLTRLSGCPPETMADTLVESVWGNWGSRLNDDTAVMWIECVGD